MKVRLLVPIRPDGGHRDRLWAFCRAYWRRERPAWKISEGRHTEGPFNRSRALNEAAEGAWDVAVILDGDTILDAEPVERAIAQAHAEGRVVLPYDHRFLVNRTGTERILDGEKGSWDRYVRGRQGPRDRYQYISGCVVVPRGLWDAVGGFDERFEGWGGEDDAFFAACTRLSGHDARTDRYQGIA